MTNMVTLTQQRVRDVKRESRSKASRYVTVVSEEDFYISLTLTFYIQILILLRSKRKNEKGNLKNRTYTIKRQSMLRLTKNLLEKEQKSLQIAFLSYGVTGAMSSEMLSLQKKIGS